MARGIGNSRGLFGSEQARNVKSGTLGARGARATKVPWLHRLADEGDDVTLELESALGTTRIEARTLLTTYRIMNQDDGLPFAFNLHQGGARYAWDGMTSYGMIERSCKTEHLTG